MRSASLPAARETPRSIRIGANVGIVVVSLLLMLCLCEIGARILLADIGTTGDRNDYLSRRWYANHPPLQNASGFRERAFAPFAPPGVLRIAAVGDSFTYGAGIQEKDRVSDLLNERLSGLRAHRYEVLNFGQPGANYPEHRANMAAAIKAAHPDFILLQWYLNDVDDPAEHRPSPKQPGWIWHRMLAGSSALYMLFSHAMTDAQVRLGLVDPDAYYARYLNPQDPLARRADERLMQVLDVARAHAIPIGVYLWPELGRPIGGPNDALIDQFLARCRRERIACVDLRAILRRVADRRRLVVNRFDAHGSPLANRLAADAILRRFGPTWVEQSGIKAAAYQAAGRQP